MIVEYSPVIRPLLAPYVVVRRWGLFKHAAYVYDYETSTANRGRALGFFVGVRCTRRGARQLAEMMLEQRRAERTLVEMNS